MDLPCFSLRGTESRPNARDVVVEGVDVAIHQGIVAADGEGLAQQREGAQHVLANVLKEGQPVPKKTAQGMCKVVMTSKKWSNMWFNMVLILLRKIRIDGLIFVGSA